MAKSSTTSSSTSDPKPAPTSGPYSSYLREQLAASSNAMIYVPLEGDAPTDDELKALAADGLHVEVDVVRNALAVRLATEDEIAAATAPPPEPEPATTVASSSNTSSTSS